MKKQLILSGAVSILLSTLLMVNSCATNNAADNSVVIKRGTGVNLGSVHATATVLENRVTGETTGDTGNYGYIDKVSNAFADSLNTGAYKNDANKSNAKNQIPNGAANKAYANAVYDIIQQIHAKGGDGLTNVLVDLERNYDPDTRTDAATVSISAHAIKLE
ncbi:MAG: hypothetical protein FWD36_01845 [Treponema sp.]|nr:hypothetical protein [Treponema sp.]